MLATRTPSPLANLDRNDIVPNDFQQFSENDDSEKVKVYSPSRQAHNVQDKMFKYIEDIRWKNNVKDCFVKLVELFGLPDTLAPQSCGSASWTEGKIVETPFSQIEIKDECIVSKRGTNYVKCCIYVSLKYDLKRSKCMSDVYSLSPSITYDSEKKTITARGESFASCVAILMVVTNVANCYEASNPKDIIKRGILADAVEMSNSEEYKMNLFIQQIRINLKNAPGSTIVREGESDS